MQQTHIVGARKLRVLSDRFGVLAFTVLRGISTAPLPARNDSVLQGSPVLSDRLFPRVSVHKVAPNATSTNAKDEGRGMTGKECKLSEG